jgi:hypothetical protein
MATKSIKNLNSFSTGYLEKITTKVDFDTTMRGETAAAIVNDNTIVLKEEAVSLSTTESVFETTAIIDIHIGQVLSGAGITGAPKISAISTDGLTITIDQPQTIAANTIITFNDSNSGLEQYDLSGSTKSRSKEDIRLSEIIPSEILNYSEDGNDSGGIRKLLESYYQFMNLEEFLYKDEVTLEDVVIDQTATFRILDPDIKNNKFFVGDLVKNARFFDEDDVELNVGTGTTTAIPSLVDITLAGTAVLVIGTTYTITSLGTQSNSDIKTDIDLIIGEDYVESAYDLGFTFVATNTGIAISAGDIVVQEMISPTISIDINVSDILITNGNNLPGQLADDINIGKTAIIRNLPSRLNNKKIKMVTLLQYYVEGNPSYRLNTIEDSLNINLADEEFLDQMQKEIAPAISKDLNVDKRALYQKIVDFYRIRGSNDSINTFFKLFFGDEEIEVEFPWNNTLKPSEGKWDTTSTRLDNYNVTNTINGSGGSAGDCFGRSIDVDGDTMIVGAPFEDTGASNNGKAYVYTTTVGNTWVEQKAFGPNATAASNNRFGIATRVSKDVAAISCLSPSKATSFVEVWERYVKNDGTLDWAFISKLEKNIGADDQSDFGRQLELYHDASGAAYMAVGAPDEANSETVSGNTLPTGSVYIYKQTGSTWQLQQKLQASPVMFPSGVTSNSSKFGGPWAGGKTFAFLDEYLAVGFSYYGNNISKSGAVALYKKQSDGQYALEKFILPEQETLDQYYGHSVDLTRSSINDDIVLAVSKLKGSSISAEVCLYRRSESLDNQIDWIKTNSFTPPTVANRNSGLYGSFLQINDDNLIISDPGVVTASGQIGLIYQYERVDGFWNDRPSATNKSASSNTEDKFGETFALSKDDKYYLVVGQPDVLDGSGSNNGKVITLNKPLQDGSYLDQKGHLSANQKIQDSDFYQKFSYVIKAPRNISQWKDIYNKLVHPAGFKFFGEILIITKLVRDILGDNRREVTVNNLPITAYSASPAFRKTFSSMPGIQPGYIGIEDIGLLIEAIASLFGPVGIAVPNKDAKLAITSVDDDGTITGISIADAGSGYDTAANNPPTISFTGGDSNAAATCTVNSRGEINTITITNGGEDYNITTATIAVQTLAQAGNSGAATAIGAANSTSLGLIFSSFGTKKYTTLPEIIIGAPNSRDAQNNLSPTNVQAAANFTYTSITAGSFVVGNAYRITAAGNTDWSSIGAPNSTVGTIFNATGVGSGNGTATDMRIAGYIITAPGLGYINNPRVTITSNPNKEKRVPLRMHKKIIPSNVLDNTVVANPNLHMTRTQEKNNYFFRKQYGQNPFLHGPKKFNGNYNLRDFSDIQIQNMQGFTSNTVPTNINKHNIQTTIDTDITNSTQPI